MLLSILQCTKQPSLPSTKNDKAPKSNRAKVEEPCSSLNLQLACSCQCLLSAPCQKSKVLNLIKDQSHLPPRPLEPNTFFPDFCIGFPRWLSGKKKNLPAKVGVTGSIPGLGRSPGEGNGNLLQYSDLGNPMNEGLAGCSHGVTKESVHGSATEQNKQNVFLSRDCNS